MPRRTTRSRSRGRLTPISPPASPSRAKKPAAKPKPKPDLPKMFPVGTDVMARWPGSSLYFKAKVTLAREVDNEYDVEYENGSVFTIRAKDIYKGRDVQRAKSKSKSRGRSQGRPRKKADVEPVEVVDATAAESSADEDREAQALAEEAEAALVKEAEAAPEEVVKSSNALEPVVEPLIIPVEIPLMTVEIPTKRIESSITTSIKTVTKRVLKHERPSRSSKRIAAKLTTEAFSDDESGSKLSPNPDLPDARGRKKGWSFEWLWATVFMVLGPTILVAQHTLCTKRSCTLAIPKLSTDYKTYTDLEVLKLVVGFSAVVNLLSFLPMGKKVKALNGADVRMNGFITLLLCVSAVGVMAYLHVPLNIVYDKYFMVMGTLIAFTFFSSLLSLILSRWATKSNINPKGNTGNLIVDFYNGREMNPRLLGMDSKLMTFRFSMITLAVLNVAMVLNDIGAKKTTFDLAGLKAINPTIAIAALFQVFYAFDAMFFEEYYFNSHDSMNSGYGWSLISSYVTFPFLPTLITKYLIDRSPHVAWYYLTGIIFIKLAGYIIFRSTEIQRCEFAKNPNNPALEHLETVETAGGRKIIVSGWWCLVRHPYFLGELLIQWSWVLPVVAAGMRDFLPYYLPIITTLMIIIRCHQINQKNKRKYGSAWDSYCEKVRSNIIPKVY